MSKINKAVAAAVMAMGASAAHAGITIPAGDWTVDIGGNVNAFYVNVNCDKNNAAGLVGGATGACGPNAGDTQNVRTGLLPSALGIGAKTRQNDLDVAFQFTFFVGADDNGGAMGAGSAGGNNSINIRQAYLTFGDKSWGTIKLGRDLGIFGSDAILSDMTLLGVGSPGSKAGGSSTLGRIGTGYMYADWKGQISYASPNWNGFSFNVGVMDPWSGDIASANHENDTLGFEAKGSYEWGGDISGKVWVGYMGQSIDGKTTVVTAVSDVNGDGVINALDGSAIVDQGYDVNAWEIGGKVAFSGFELVGNYESGEGLGNGLFGMTGSNGAGRERDADTWYVQASYKLPTYGTKLAVSYGEGNVDKEVGETNDASNDSWIVGVYHPLTKSLNLVAEYQDITSEDFNNNESEVNVFSLGAIMFF